jgi:hypothetical protein
LFCFVLFCFVLWKKLLADPGGFDLFHCLILCRDRRTDDGRLECRVSRSPTGPGPAPVTAVNFPCLAPHLSPPSSYWVIIILYTLFLWCRFFVMRCCVLGSLPLMSLYGHGMTEEVGSASRRKLSQLSSLFLLLFFRVGWSLDEG